LPFLLARGFGQGRVFLFAVAADRRWSDWPLSPMFLPVLHQVAQQAAGGVRQPLYVSTGEDVEMTDVTAVTEGAELVTPAGERLPVRSTRTDGKVRLSVERLDEPGVYRSAPRGGGEPVPVLAANLPRRESNLVPLEPARVPALFADARLVVARDREELLHAVEQHRVGRPLDEVLLWAVFALALVEVFVANRAGRRVDTVLDRLKVDLSGRVREGAAPQ
jgi:hypothetical protein